MLQVIYIGASAFQGTGQDSMIGVACRSRVTPGKLGRRAWSWARLSTAAETSAPPQKSRPDTMPPKPAARQISSGNCTQGKASRSWSTQRRRNRTFQNHMVAPTAIRKAIQAARGTSHASTRGACQNVVCP